MPYAIREFILNHDDYISVMQKCVWENGLLIKVFNKNIIIMRKRQEKLKEIIREPRSFYFFKKYLIPQFPGNVVFFKKLDSGGIHFKLRIYDYQK